MSLELSGILPALVTPLHADETLNVRSVERLLERVYRANVDGVYLCGTTGEGLLLPIELRKQVLETVRKNSPTSKRVIVHVGAGSLRESLLLARHAEQQGATAISSLPPVGAAFPEIVEYYRSLAAATALPFLAYYFPAPGAAGWSIDQLLQITALPNVAGLKFTDFDLYSLQQLRAEGKVVFNGRDEVLAAGLLMGASGGIGSIYNLCPSRFVRLYALARSGEWEQARAVQAEINALIRMLLRYPLFAAIKQILTWQGIDCGTVVPPRLPLTEEQTLALRVDLEPFAGMLDG